MARTVQLGLLEQVRIASPCPVRWDDMQGDERVRFCGQCSLNVYNLSEMTREEAEKLILSKQGRLCAGFFRRADGTVITRDCPVGLRAARMRAARSAGRVAAAAALLLSGTLALGAKRGWWSPGVSELEPFASVQAFLAPGRALKAQTQWIAGDVCVPPPPAPGSGLPQ
jgi:hypothetical protein